MNKPQAVLFDLDNTLYPKEADLFSIMDKRINRFMNENLGIPAHDVDRLRKEYWVKYGLTLNGLMLHHDVNPEQYLLYIHDIDVKKYLKSDYFFSKALLDFPFQKIVFTNSCGFYAQKVLEALGLSQVFEAIFDIRKANLKPKPDPFPYKKILNDFDLSAKYCVMVDDSLINLKTAHELGMKTILVGSDEQSDYINASAMNQHQIVKILNTWKKK